MYYFQFSIKLLPYHTTTFLILKFAYILRRSLQNQDFLSLPLFLISSLALKSYFYSCSVFWACWVFSKLFSAKPLKPTFLCLKFEVFASVRPLSKKFFVWLYTDSTIVLTISASKWMLIFEFKLVMQFMRLFISPPHPWPFLALSTTAIYCLKTIHPCLRLFTDKFVCVCLNFFGLL